MGECVDLATQHILPSPFPLGEGLMLRPDLFGILRWTPTVYADVDRMVDHSKILITRLPASSLLKKGKTQQFALAAPGQGPPPLASTPLRAI